jgi:hypothetical protein
MNFLIEAIEENQEQGDEMIEEEQEVIKSRRNIMNRMSRIARDFALRTREEDRDKIEKNRLMKHSRDITKFHRVVKSDHDSRQKGTGTGQQTSRSASMSATKRSKSPSDVEETFASARGKEDIVTAALKVGHSLPASFSTLISKDVKEIVGQIRGNTNQAREPPSMETARATDRSNTSDDGVNQENLSRITLDLPVLPPIFPPVILKVLSESDDVTQADREAAQEKLEAITNSLIDDYVSHAREQKKIDNIQATKQARVLREELQGLKEEEQEDQDDQFKELSDDLARMGVHSNIYNELMIHNKELMGMSIAGFEVSLLDTSKIQPPEGPPGHVETFALWSSGIPHDIVTPRSSAASSEQVQSDYMTGAIHLVKNASPHHKTIILTNSNLNDAQEFLEAVRSSPGVVEVWHVQHTHSQSYPDGQDEGHREMLSSIMRLILAVTPGWKTIVFRDADSGAHYIEDSRLFEYIRSIKDTNPERLEGLAFVGPTYSVDSSSANFNGLMHRSVRFERYGTLRLSMGRFMLLKQLSEVDLAQMVHHGLLCTGLYNDPELSLSAAEAEANAGAGTGGAGEGDGVAVIGQGDIGEGDSENEGDQARHIEGCQFRHCLARYSREVLQMTVGSSYSGQRMNKTFNHFQYSCDEKALNFLVADLLYRDANLGGFQIIWHPGFQTSNDPQVTELIYYGNDEIEERLTMVIHEATKVAEIPI